jgi:hypothetical protein
LGNSAQVRFTLHAGQGFVVNGRVEDYKACGARDLYCDSMEFIEPYTFENLTGFVAKTATLSNAACGADVTYEIATE